MVRQIFRALFVVLLGIALASCARKPPVEETRPLLYDVREAAVVAGEGVSPALMRGVDRRLADAIAATQRPLPSPRVVLSVNIGTVVKGSGNARGRNSATFTVSAVAVDSGAVIAAGTFKVDTVSINPTIADQSLAEEIAARIRFAFALVTPSVKPVRLSQRTSTRLIGDAPASADATPMLLPVSPIVPKVAPAVEQAPVGSDLEGGAKATISLTPPAAAPAAVTTPATAPVTATATGEATATPASATAVATPVTPPTVPQGHTAKTSDPAAAEPCVVTATQDCSPAQ